jgi:hypothetical protein
MVSTSSLQQRQTIVPESSIGVDGLLEVSSLSHPSTSAFTSQKRSSLSVNGFQNQQFIPQPQSSQMDSLHPQFSQLPTAPARSYLHSAFNPVNVQPLSSTSDSINAASLSESFTLQQPRNTLPGPSSVLRSQPEPQTREPQENFQHWQGGNHQTQQISELENRQMQQTKSEQSSSDRGASTRSESVHSVIQQPVSGATVPSSNSSTFSQTQSFVAALAKRFEQASELLGQRLVSELRPVVSDFGFKFIKFLSVDFL